MTVTTLSDITSFKWATVTVASPLAIKLDGDTAALALVPDSLVDPLSMVVGDRVRVELSVRKCIIHGVANQTGRVESGRVELTARSTAPNGWLLCNGASLLRTSFPGLFAAIGTTYGAVDSTHFTVPNTLGRTVVGMDATQTAYNALGKAGGAATHSHTLSDAGQAQIVVGVATPPILIRRVTSAAWTSTHTFGASNGAGAGSPETAAAALMGSTDAGSSLDPYVALNYIIKI